MELRQLGYYRAVAELLSFSAAARKLGVAQSAVSRQIKALEGEIGAKLFDRSRSHVALTRTGEAFYHEVRRLLDEADVVVSHAREVARQRK